MKFIFNFVLLVIVFIFFRYVKTNSVNFDFTSPDIIVETKLNGTRIRLEAFKASTNDLILGNKTQDEYSRLHWLSVGYPSLIAPSFSPEDATGSLFTWSHTGFHTYIETLTDEHKALLVNKIQRQYNIVKIDTDQIHSLITENFDCKINLDCNSMSNESESSAQSEYIQLFGRVENPWEYPLILNFEITPKIKPYRQCIQQKLFHDLQTKYN